MNAMNASYLRTQTFKRARTAGPARVLIYPSGGDDNRDHGTSSLVENVLFTYISPLYSKRRQIARDKVLYRNEVVAS